jgi:hypothetical protein
MKNYRHNASRLPSLSPSKDEPMLLSSRRAVLLMLGLLLMALGMLNAAACSLFTSKNVSTALDVAKIACILANAESDDATVKTVCNILEAEDAALRTVLKEQRQASRRFAAASAKEPKDGGVEAASPASVTSPEAGGKP